MAIIALSKKLYHFRNSLARKQQLVFGTDQLDLICRHKPMDLDTLKTKCKLSESQLKAYGKQLLAITTVHGRNQEQFEECIAEMRAFVNGGKPGLMLLNRVYKQIIAHYKAEAEMHDALKAAGVYTDMETGILKKRARKEEEDFY